MKQTVCAAKSVERFVAYLRVSTERQGQSRLGLEAQQASISNFISQGDRKLIAEFTEIQSGKRVKNRPALLRAIRECRLRNATLLVAKLDRLSREIWFVTTLQRLQLKFVCADSPHISDLTVHILAAMAEHERRMISERTKAALRAAKARGVKLGNPRLAKMRNTNSDAARATRTEHADAFAANVMLHVEELRALGLRTLNQIALGLNEREVPTRQGKQWTPTAVRRVLLRKPRASDLEVLLQ